MSKTERVFVIFATLCPERGRGTEMMHYNQSLHIIILLSFCLQNDKMKKRCYDQSFHVACDVWIGLHIACNVWIS